MDRENELDRAQVDRWGEMDPEAFRRWGYRAVDWIVEYLTHPDRYPVLARTEPGAIRSALPAAPPSTPEPMEAIWADFEETVVPGLTHWNHPRFFAYFPAGTSGPGILGELLTAALNVNAMLWATSPAATELEEVVTDWLRRLLGLPEAFRGALFDGASAATLVALAAARERLGLGVREKGLAGRDLPRLRLYASEEAHSSVEKAAIVLGIGREGVRKIPTDEAFRMDPAALEAAVAEDRRRGWLPFAVVATVGTTSSTSIDPVPALAAICRREGLWLHVDGAYGGMAALVPEHRHVLEGCEAADSIVVNPHKWLFTPLDCSAFYVRDVAVLKRAFRLVPEYLRTDREATNDYMDWGIQLGRRFRALKLWFVLRYFGAEGLAARIRRHIEMAQTFARWVDEDPEFERTAPTPLSTVCFRARPAGWAEPELERLNEAILAEVNASGIAFLSHTRLRGRYTLRLAVGNLRTREEDLERAWTAIRDALPTRGQGKG